MNGSECPIHSFPTSARQDRRCNAFLVGRYVVMVKKRRFTGICFLGENHVNANHRRLVLDLFQQFPEWNVVEVLIGLLAQVEVLFPAIVLPDNDTSNAVLDTVLDDELGSVVKVVFQTPVAFSAVVFVQLLVEPLVDTLDDTTIDQYGRVLVGSYRHHVIQPNINAGNTLSLDFIRHILFILHIHHEPEGFGCDDYLLELAAAFDAEAFIGRSDNATLEHFLLDRLGVENYLCQFILVVWRFRHSGELALILLPCVQCFLEVAPVRQHLPDRLFGGLRVVQVLKAFFGLNQLNERLDVRHQIAAEPCLTHVVVALVVQLLASLAEGDDFRRAFDFVSFNEKHTLYMRANPVFLAQNLAVEQDFPLGFRRFP